MYPGFWMSVEQIPRLAILYVYHLTIQWNHTLTCQFTIHDLQIIIKPDRTRLGKESFYTSYTDKQQKWCRYDYLASMSLNRLLQWIRGCIQKFPDWPPGTRTTNGTAFCH